MADCLLFLVAKIFIQISFAPREAMTTAEPPEPLPFQHSKFIITKQFFRQIVGPARGIRVQSCPLVVPNKHSVLQRLIEPPLLANKRLQVAYKKRVGLMIDIFDDIA